MFMWLLQIVFARRKDWDPISHFNIVLLFGCRILVHRFPFVLWIVFPICCGIIYCRSLLFVYSQRSRHFVVVCYNINVCHYYLRYDWGVVCIVVGLLYVLPWLIRFNIWTICVVVVCFCVDHYCLRFRRDVVDDIVVGCDCRQLLSLWCAGDVVDDIVDGCDCRPLLSEV